MSFNWVDFISFAEELCKNRSDEASLRSSISRSYYGAFGKARIYCEAKYRIKQSFGDSIHQKVIETLKASDDRREFSVGNTLSILRNSRNDVDYDGHFKINKPLVDQSIQKSRAIVQQLNELIEEDI